MKKILFPLTNIIKTYFINKYSSGFSPISNENNYINCSTNYNTYNLYNGGKNLIKLEISNYELMTKNYFNFNNIKEENLYVIEFYFCLHLFIINNMDVKELISDVSKRKKIFDDLFKIITDLEIMLVKNPEKENNIINDGKEDNIKYILINYIIMAIQIILIILEINDKSYIQDCFILYKSLQNNVQLLLEIDNKNNDNEVQLFNVKIIYSIIFFILSQFIRLINIPNSINKKSIDILDSINQYNEKSGKYLSNINVPNFIIAKESVETNFQYLKELLLSKDKENDSNFINYNIFKQILDIIYSKLFGKESSLNIFFDNQIPNSNIYSHDEENSYDRSVSKLSDNITEPKDNSIINNYANNCNENFIEAISIQIIEQKNKMKNNSNEIGNLFVKQDSDINIPGSYNISSNILGFNFFLARFRFIYIYIK
jgi:transcription initiation factor TFIIIB Brf1 subunit/transcription initiation factor TFIIB